jgi:hypothetical protein
LVLSQQCENLSDCFQEEKIIPVMINGIKPVSPEQEELIHRLVYFQNEYEQPSEEDLKRIMVRNGSIQYNKQW